jgi:hypothetical protein
VRACRSSEQRVWLGPGKHCDRCGDAGTNSDCFADSCVKRYSVRGNTNAYTYSNGYGNCNSYTDSYSYCNSYGHADSYTPSDTKSPAYAASSPDPVVRSKPRIDTN